MWEGAKLPETPNESGVSTRSHREHSLKLPVLHSRTWPCLGKLEQRPNPSGFTSHTAEIFLVGFIFTQIPRTQRRAGK